MKQFIYIIFFIAVSVCSSCKSKETPPQQILPDTIKAMPDSIV